MFVNHYINLQDSAKVSGKHNSSSFSVNGGVCFWYIFDLLEVSDRLALGENLHRTEMFGQSCAQGNLSPPRPIKRFSCDVASIIMMLRFFIAVPAPRIFVNVSAGNLDGFWGLNLYPSKGGDFSPEISGRCFFGEMLEFTPSAPRNV